MSGGFNALRSAIVESRARAVASLPPINAFEPYALPTDKATQALRAAMKRDAPWGIPGPLSDREAAELDTFMETSGVRFPNATLFEKRDADRDLAPYVMAWRVQRGDVLLTRHGLIQFGDKPPFSEATA